MDRNSPYISVVKATCERWKYSSYEGVPIAEVELIIRTLVFSFTYKTNNCRRLANTPSGRNVIAFEDKDL